MSSSNTVDNDRREKKNVKDIENTISDDENEETMHVTTGVNEPPPSDDDTYEYTNYDMDIANTAPNGKKTEDETSKKNAKSKGASSAVSKASKLAKNSVEQVARNRKAIKKAKSVRDKAKLARDNIGIYIHRTRAVELFYKNLTDDCRKFGAVATALKDAVKTMESKQKGPITHIEKRFADTFCESMVKTVKAIDNVNKSLTDTIEHLSSMYDFIDTLSDKASDVEAILLRYLCEVSDANGRNGLQQSIYQRKRMMKNGENFNNVVMFGKSIPEDIAPIVKSKDIVPNSFSGTIGLRKTNKRKDQSQPSGPQRV